jgi:adenosylcobinamide-phosphate synthase
MEKYTFLILPLAIGYILDLLLGDPRRLPHPIRAFGWMIAKGETWLNKPPHAFLKGMAMTLFLCAGTFILLSVVLDRLSIFNKALYLTISSIGAFYGLANRQLIIEGKLVYTRLQQQGLEAGRQQLATIVGRDTNALSPSQIKVAVLETMSENLSDAVVAPLFYYALAGLPGMLTYKMINTLDSMIGYRNERYIQFGKFAARLDDVANFIPARLTAVIMALVTASRRSFTYIVRYGHRHKSPNAGYPEAALAGILDTRFGGPNYYQGELVEKPYIGEHNREIQPAEIDKVAAINHKVCLLMVILAGSYIYIINGKF